eukprot:TRINITY_DN34488_c0_g1_i1.p2 TRINITY_DN34488_c0_g1~~TRINITY_DN34488_c0_g1_i1.p2  ORF type:complete len:104 (-),score=5.10 TRINITY_DN34488_c0_g1_i1:26-337(-)
MDQRLLGRQNEGRHTLPARAVRLLRQVHHRISELNAGKDHTVEKPQNEDDQDRGLVIGDQRPKVHHIQIKQSGHKDPGNRETNQRMSDIEFDQVRHVSFLTAL